jgi:hypothetical protein
MSDVKRWVSVRTSFRGIHHWPGCPHEDISFLRSPHRHVFHVTVSVEVAGDDREVEFFQLQREIDAILGQAFDTADGVLVLDARSCEMIADEIHTRMVEGYPVQEIRISVSEDNENEAMCEYSALQSALSSTANGRRCGTS